MVLSESVGTELMGTNTRFCGILTFAIRSHLSVVLNQGQLLGENHQKLAIPAAYVKGGRNEVASHERWPTSHDGSAPLKVVYRCVLPSSVPMRELAFW
jgi:hypothetical protein